MILPDCMMPDGAEPCKGYRELDDKVRRLETMVRAQAEEIATLNDQLGSYKRLKDFWGAITNER